ncbi:Ureidoglycolate lyase [Symmachiella macrocystis]|uniref:Ureidoglycolate lyase n=1 Tax=Symmachiella macrocystis TaxID=2527985 RepID=A0A5C6AWS8_9PLAN|nr:fumarylacetoacetate hydrolase family protein [Symmachiella macrocystis]TWU04200.1 Ureidoglycolate lyase [Symmachiella macrocystis]
MKSWCRILVDGSPHLGLRQDEHILIHEGDLFANPVPTGREVDVAEAEWLAPVEPRQFLGLWNNLHEAMVHGGNQLPLSPLYFTKLPDCLNRYQGDIPAPKGFGDKVLFEAELGVVIGRECFQPSRDAIDDYIFGYTCVNDVTAAEPLFENKEFPQWTRAKSYPGFGPIGPCIVRGIEPDELQVQAFLDGEKKQDYPVSDMIFSPRDAVWQIARELTLYPGDVIACGTSVGTCFMKPGQQIEIRISGLGSLVNCFAG